MFKVQLSILLKCLSPELKHRLSKERFTSPNKVYTYIEHLQVKSEDYVFNCVDLWRIDGGRGTACYF